MPIYLFIKKAIEKRSYYSDTPGKFALLKELKRNFLQIFVVDSSCFCNFIIRKTKCFDFWERNVLFPKTKRSFFRTPTLPFSA